MSLTELALENDQNLHVTQVPVKSVYLDHDFNCRGWFSPQECVELARDIAERGLQQPITVRPLRTEKRNELLAETELIDKGYLYKVISGHRRMYAYQINETEMIPAIVKDAYLSEFDQKDLNAIENLQRKELNLQQEANSIRHYWMACWSREDIARRIGKSPGWVQIRLMLLEMPEDVQKLAGQGYLKTDDVRTLNKIKKPDELLRTAGLMRDAYKKGERGVAQRIAAKRSQKSTTKKYRSRAEILKLQEEIQDLLSQVNLEQQVSLGDIITKQGNTLVTFTLAYCAGEINAIEYHMQLRDFMNKLGVEHELPNFLDAGMI